MIKDSNLLETIFSGGVDDDGVSRYWQFKQHKLRFVSASKLEEKDRVISQTHADVPSRVHRTESARVESAQTDNNNTELNSHMPKKTSANGDEKSYF